jgi:hypothetical protein
MQVACPSCGHVLSVPPDKAALPNIKAKCRCGTVFPLASTAAAAAAAAAPGAATLPSPVSDRVAAIRAANARAAALGASGGTMAAPLIAPKLPPRPAGVPAGAPLRTAAAVPRPAMAPPAGAASAVPASVSASAAIAPKPRTVPVPWRRCQNHPQTRSEHVCPKCGKGYCNECPQRVQTAVVCPACEGFCVATAAYEELQGREKQRDRSMVEEIPVIAGYPLRDGTAYVMLALFTWFFGLFSGFSGIMLLLSKGVLTWYSFNAVARVSMGNLRDVMPDFRDQSDISQAARLSVAALGISAGPLLLCLLLIPGATAFTKGRTAESAQRELARALPAHAAPAADRDEAGSEAAAAMVQHMPHVVDPFEARRDGPESIVGPLAVLGIVVAGLWMVVYMPVALTVAALSKSILSTINPTIGIDTIKKMGGVYWQALGLYVALLFGQVVLGWGLRLIPLAGSLAAGFVDAYVALAVGCTLGMAVFKKAVELGWD